MSSPRHISGSKRQNGGAGAKSSKTCTYCDRSFARREHLLRHEKTHTQDKPFACPNCHLPFQRHDAQLRHTTKFCAGSAATQQPVSRKRKLRFACDICHYKKQKCNGKQPCTFCSSLSSTCSYTREGSVRGMASHAPNATPQASNISAESLEYTPHERNALSMNTPIPIAPQDVENAAHGPSYSLPLASVPAQWHTDGLSQLTGPDFHNSSTRLEILPGSIDTLFDNQIGPSVPSVATDSQIVTAFNPGKTDAYSELWGDSTYPDTWPDNYDFVFSDDFASGNTIYYPQLNNFFTSGQEENFCKFPATAALNPSAAMALAKLHESTEINSHPASEQLIEWLKTSPVPGCYGKPTINSFLNFFAINVTPMFPSFEGFRITQHTLPELTLAMAAVGGLFCAAPESFTVARAMYNDAQRMHSTRLHTKQYDSRNTETFKLSIVQTYILFELFGLYGGDNRYFEYCQAFHMQMIQIIHEYKLLSSAFTNIAEHELARKRVLDGVRMIECYRVVLLHRPPEVYLFENFGPSSASDVAMKSSGANSWPDIKYFMTPDSPLTPIVCPYVSKSSLAALAAVSWWAMPIGPGMSQLRRLWPQEMFDLALNRWVRAHEIQIDPATMILFHSTSIMIRTNVTHIHGLVALHLRNSPCSTDLHNTAFKPWSTISDCTTARWHAEKIVELAETKFGTRTPIRRQKHHGVGEGSTHSEGPHVALCAYYAYLTLWAATMMEELEDPKKGSAADILDRGLGTLSCFKVRVAEILLGTLQSLRTVQSPDIVHT